MLINSQYSSVTSGCARDLATRTWPHFDVVHDTPNGYISQGQTIPRGDVCLCTSDHLITGATRDRSQNVRQHTVFVLNQSDVRGTIRSVFDTQNSCGDIFTTTFEIYKTKSLLMAAALMFMV